MGGGSLETLGQVLTLGRGGALAFQQVEAKGTMECSLWPLQALSALSALIQSFIHPANNYLKKYPESGLEKSSGDF